MISNRCWFKGMYKNISIVYSRPLSMRPRVQLGQPTKINLHSFQFPRSPSQNKCRTHLVDSPTASRTTHCESTHPLRVEPPTASRLTHCQSTHPLRVQKSGKKREEKHNTCLDVADLDLSLRSRGWMCTRSELLDNSERKNKQCYRSFHSATRPILCIFERLHRETHMSPKGANHIVKSG